MNAKASVRRYAFAANKQLHYNLKTLTIRVRGAGKALKYTRLTLFTRRCWCWTCVGRQGSCLGPECLLVSRTGIYTPGYVIRITNWPLQSVINMSL